MKSGSDGEPEFRSGIIEKYADHLYRRAASLVMGATVVGAIIGAIFGGMPLTHYVNWPIPHSAGYATAMIGALIGGFIGHVVGESRAFGLRIQAQMALHQLRVDQNTTAVAAAVVPQAAQASPRRCRRSRAPVRPRLPRLRLPSRRRRLLRPAAAPAPAVLSPLRRRPRPRRSRPRRRLPRLRPRRLPRLRLLWLRRLRHPSPHLCPRR